MKKRNWALPPDLIAASIDSMSSLGAQGCEGLALWFGRLEEGTAIISHVVQPYGRGFQTSPLYLRLSMRAIGQLTDFADKEELFLIGQIHSHPGTFVDLSEIDIEQGFRIQNFLSVVCPYYAQSPETTFSHCGVHVFDDGRYRRLSQSDVAATFTVAAISLTRVKIEVEDD